MKRLILLMLNIIFLGAFPQNFQWARAVGSDGDDRGDKILIDGSGNVCTIGSFSGITDFDPGSGTFFMTPTSSVSSNNWKPDVFICKMDPNGNFLWAKQIGGPGIDWIITMDFDGSGNIYLFGHFQATADFDPGPGVYNLSAGFGNYDNFICKLDASGNFLWAKQLSSNGSAAVIGYGMAVDAIGNVFLEGFFQGSIDFDPGTGNTSMTASYGSAFIDKLNASGNFVWAKKIGSNTTGQSISLDASGNIYHGGYFEGTSDFDPGPGVFNLSTTGISDGDVFISKLDGSGNFLWARKVGGPGSEALSDLLQDPSGNSFIAGTFQSVADFDPGPAVFNLVSNGNDDIFIAKLDASGNLAWAKSIGAWDPETVNGISYVSGNICLTGDFDMPVDFDPGPSVFNLSTLAYGDADAYVAMLDGSGNFVWAGRFGGEYFESGHSIACDPGNIYVTGQFSSLIVDFDPGQGITNYPVVGGSDIFVSKFGLCFSPSVTVNTAMSQVCAGNTTTLTATSNGIVSWFATANSTLALANGTVFNTPSLTPGTYTFYAEALTCTTTSVRVSANLTVLALPQIYPSIQPSIVCSGQPAVLNVVGSALSYSWAGLGGGVSFVVNPPSNTSYTVTGTDVNNCMNSAVITLTLADCTGISINKSWGISLNVFPNPAKDELQIQAADETSAKLCIASVYNNLGQLVFEEQLIFKDQRARIATVQMPDGIYILKLHAGPEPSTDGSQTVSKKIVISR